MKKVREIATTIITDNRKVFLIKRKYDPYKNSWCPPGGFTNKEIKESVEDCAVRETKEETGIDVKLIKKIKILENYNKKKDRIEEIHIFLAKPLSLITKASDEVLDYKWFNIKELDKIPIVPRFKQILLEVLNS